MSDKHRELLRATAKEYDDATMFGILPSVESFIKLRNALGASVEASGDLLEIVRRVRSDWLGETPTENFERKWSAMAELIDYVDHGATSESWLAYKKHRQRAAEPKALPQPEPPPPDDHPFG